MLQFGAMRYAGRVLYVTLLSFKEDICCLVIGLLSVYFNFMIKLFMPSHFVLTGHRVEIGKFKW